MADVKEENERSIERRLRVGNVWICMVADLLVATRALYSACVDEKTGQLALVQATIAPFVLLELIRIRNVQRSCLTVVTEAVVSLTGDCGRLREQQGKNLEVAIGAIGKQFFHKATVVRV